MVGFPIIKNTFQLTSFSHFINHDAQYYSYLWSDIYAADIFYEKFKGNIFNSREGIIFRKMILEKGGAIDGNVMIHQYLGRDFKINNYFKSKGLSIESFENIECNIINKPIEDHYIYTSDDLDNNKINIDFIDDY